MVAMADSPSPDPDGCFHCPQGDKPCPVTYQPGAWLARRPRAPPPSPGAARPCPVTYQPGAWLAQLPAKPTAAVPDRPHRADEIDASVQQALRKLYEAVGGDARRAGRPDRE